MDDEGAALGRMLASHHDNMQHQSRPFGDDDTEAPTAGRAHNKLAQICRSMASILAQEGTLRTACCRCKHTLTNSAVLPCQHKYSSHVMRTVNSATDLLHAMTRRTQTFA